MLSEVGEAKLNYKFSCSCNSPSQSTWFHFVRERHIIRPNIELPLSQTKNAAEDVASVDTDSHVDIAARRLPHKPTIIELLEVNSRRMLNGNGI